MAPRSARVAAQDQLADARAKLRQVNISIARHAMTCAPCCFAHGHTDRLCDAGWQLAKDQARANAAIRHLTEPAPAAPVQGELW